MNASTKRVLRNDLKTRIKSLSTEYISLQSLLICNSVQNHPNYIESKVVSLYIPMKYEVSTYSLIQHVFDSNKRLFISKVIGKQSSDMLMLEMSAYNDLEIFPMNSWGIKEPTNEYANEASQAIEDIDVVIVPAVGFDSNCARLGHGKGYYGNYIIVYLISLILFIICRLFSL